MKTPILGSAYVARSVNAADNQMINLFPELVPEAGKEPAFLQRTPGLNLIGQAGPGKIRGMWVLGDYLYIVSGNQFWKFNSSYAGTFIGYVTNTTEAVSISDNGTQIFIACNGPSYIYNVNTGAFGPITDPDFPGAVSVGYLDGYFVFNEPNSQRIWVTQLLDGTSIDPLDFASAEGSPDGVIGLIVDHREVWVFGTSSTEVWYDAGTTDFPLQRIQGAFNELGCAAPYSIAKADNSIFWLGKDARGQGIVYRANGYTGVRISTHAVEWQIQQSGDLSNAVGYTYQQDGHTFYVLNFQNANTTWVYDVATQAWHERRGWENSQWTRHRGNCQAFFNNQNVIGDFENANVYYYDPNYYADGLLPQRWLRTWRALPTGQNDLHRTAHHKLQLDCETGVGLNDAPVGTQGNDPEVMLRWSDDGGHTWSFEHWRKMGRIGEYGYRTIWRRLGMSVKIRDRVYEISGTDPVKIAIMGAELELSKTNA